MLSLVANGSKRNERSGENNWVSKCHKQWRLWTLRTLQRRDAFLIKHRCNNTNLYRNKPRSKLIYERKGYNIITYSRSFQ